MKEACLAAIQHFIGSLKVSLRYKFMANGELEEWKHLQTVSGFPSCTVTAGHDYLCASLHGPSCHCNSCDSVIKMGEYMQGAARRSVCATPGYLTSRE